MLLRTTARPTPYLVIAATSFILTVFVFGLAFVLGLAIFTIGTAIGLSSRDPRRIAIAERWTLSGLAIVVGPSIYLALAIIA